jgi:hypothetical protein
MLLILNYLLFLIAPRDSRTMKIKGNRREKLAQFFEDRREAAWRFREPSPL